MGRDYKTGAGGNVKFATTKGGGGDIILAMLKGGHKIF